MKKNGMTDKVNGEKMNDETMKVGTTVYNLIILDESGSMDCVRSQTISGCNETLNGIRVSAKEHPEVKQVVSIYCFDSSNPRYIFENVPVEETRDVTKKDYKPCALTPLYDAIGKTVTELRNRIGDSGAVGMVTIITDGYENDSHEWSHGAVMKLIEDLKAKGWVFTFIGANIDVQATAVGLGITSYMVFEQTPEGMRDMFAKERRSRKAYNEKRSYMEKMKERMVLDGDEELRMNSAMNNNFFMMEERRESPKVIKELKEDEVFVFGSDEKGTHQIGAAVQAVKQFGAVVGQAEGPQGQCYAIPSVGVSLVTTEVAVNKFTDYVVRHPEKKFILTDLECGRSEYSVEQIASLFKTAYSFGNLYAPRVFRGYVELLTF